VLTLRTARGVAPLALALSIASCGSDDVAAPPVHPRLQCVGDERGFHPPADLDISGPGSETADAALRKALQGSIEVLGEGVIVVLTPTEYGVAIDGRVVMIRVAVTNADGEWHATDSFYCSTDPSGMDLVLDESV
jgi:hypothetical protein